MSCLNFVSFFFSLLFENSKIKKIKIKNKIVQHPSLAVKNEFSVYTAIINYIQTKQQDLSSDDIQSLFENVR